MQKTLIIDFSRTQSAYIFNFIDTYAIQTFKFNTWYLVLPEHGGFSSSMA